MTAEFVRDAAGTAAVLGFFASSWFGWALDDPPPKWRKWLLTGIALSLLTAVCGGLLTWRHWSDPTAIGPATGPIFGVVVGLEFAIAGLGSWLLARRERHESIPAWIALAVGIHFVPLALLLHYPIFYPLAALVVLAAVSGPALARRRGSDVGSVVGLSTGTVLLAAALFSLGSVFFL